MKINDFKALCKKHNAVLAKREGIYSLSIDGVRVSALIKATTKQNLVKCSPLDLLMSKLRFEKPDSQAIKAFEREYREANEFVYG